MKTDKLILDACCGPRMMWFDKRNPQAVFMDIRDEEHILCDGRSLEVHPDVIGDFRSIPFEDATFRLVVFDPPHLVRLGDNSYMAHKYGKLLSTWETDLKQGFDECMRVLKPEGVLIFKWCEEQIPVSRIIEIFRSGAAVRPQERQELQNAVDVFYENQQPMTHAFLRI